MWKAIGETTRYNGTHTYLTTLLGLGPVKEKKFRNYIMWVEKDTSRGHTVIRLKPQCHTGYTCLQNSGSIIKGLLHRREFPVQYYKPCGWRDYRSQRGSNFYHFTIWM